MYTVHYVYVVRNVKLLAREVALNIRAARAS